MPVLLIIMCHMACVWSHLVAINAVWFGVSASLCTPNFKTTWPWSNLHTPLAVTLVSTSFHCSKPDVTMVSGSHKIPHKHVPIITTTACDESSSFWETFCKWYGCHSIARGHEHRSITTKFVTPTAPSCIDNSWRSTTLSPPKKLTSSTASTGESGTPSTIIYTR